MSQNLKSYKTVDAQGRTHVAIPTPAGTLKCTYGPTGELLAETWLPAGADPHALLAALGAPGVLEAAKPPRAGKQSRKAKAAKPDAAPAAPKPMQITLQAQADGTLALRFAEKPRWATRSAMHGTWKWDSANAQWVAPSNAQTLAFAQSLVAAQAA